MSDIKVKFYNQKAEKIGEEKLSKDVFGLKANPGLVKQVVVAQRANARQVLAHAKGRSEVRGGGKKPWKQKGTGRARVGSSRSPIWIGGGVTFGSTKERNFSLKINKKMKRKALLMGLSDKVKNDDMILLDKVELDKVKTKEMAGMFQKFQEKIIKKNERKRKPSILLVLGEKQENVIKSIRNISRVGVIGVNSLNLVDVLKYEYLLITLPAIQKIEKTYNR